MAKYTKEAIAAVAKNACFYVTPDDRWLRMQWCDEDAGKFCAADEDSGEDYIFKFEDMCEIDDPQFHEITRSVF